MESEANHTGVKRCWYRRRHASSGFGRVPPQWQSGTGTGQQSVSPRLEPLREHENNLGSNGPATVVFAASWCRRVSEEPYFSATIYIFHDGNKLGNRLSTHRSEPPPPHPFLVMLYDAPPLPPRYSAASSCGSWSLMPPFVADFALLLLS